MVWRSRAGSVLAALWENTEILLVNANGFDMDKALWIIINIHQIWNVVNILVFALPEHL